MTTAVYTDAQRFNINGGTKRAGRQRTTPGGGRGSIAGDTEISFGSLRDDESVISVSTAAAAAAAATNSTVPEHLLDNIGMADFTSDEKFQLDSVLQRVNAAQALDDKRKERLRQQLQSALTQASSVQENLRNGLLYSMCELCGGKLYPFSRRYVCQRCQNLACSGCAQLLKGGDSVQCRLCHLEFVTEAQSGEWFLAEVRRRTERAYFGPEILRASLRRERRRLVSEEKARRAAAAAEAAAAAAAEEADLHAINGVDEIRVHDAIDGSTKQAASAAAAAAADVPEPAAIKEFGKRGGKKKDRKERDRDNEKEKDKQKQKASKEGKKRDKKRKQSPEPPPPPPPPPPPQESVAVVRVESADRGSGGSGVKLPTVIVQSADSESDQEVAIDEPIQAAASVDLPDGPNQPDDELPTQRDTPTPPEAEETISHVDSSALWTSSKEAAAAAAAVETSNLRVVDAPIDELQTAQQWNRINSMSVVNLTLIDDSITSRQQNLYYYNSRQYLSLSHSPSRLQSPVLAKLAKRATSALLDLRVRALFNGAHGKAKTSCESVLSNISETEESYRLGLRATGEVELSAQFHSGVLTVLIHRCRNLTRVDGRQPSPYVKTYLLPDKTKRSKRRTHARRGTCNPSYGAQPLIYADLTAEQLEMRTLQVSVWHSVPLGANVFLGEARLPLEQCQTIFSGGKHWLRLAERHSEAGGVSLPTMMYQGELTLSIRFEFEDAAAKDNEGARGTLEIWVRSCSKLASASGGSPTLDVSPYVKSYLLPSRHTSSKRKSKVAKGNPNPQFNAIFTYHGVTRRELRERSIELTVWDHVLLGRNDFLGGVRLNIGDNTRNSWMDARGHEQTLWTGMLQNPGKWIDASLILRPNMDPLATHIAQ